MPMLLLKASIVLLVIGIGLQATMRDAVYLVRHPGLFARTILSMHVLMPAVTLALCIGFGVRPALKVALLTLSISPVPPFLPPRVSKAAGDGSYIIGLLVAMSLLSIAIVPVSLHILGTFFDLPIHTPMPAVLKVVVTSVLGPLAIGLAIRHFVPSSARFAKPVTTAATVLMVVAVVPLLMKSWPAVRVLLGDGTLLMIATITLAGLAIGHPLGGPAREDRAVLALSTASRHPAVAMVVATANFPEEKLIVPAILLALIVSALVATPYVVWRKRGAARETVRT